MSGGSPYFRVALRGNTLVLKLRRRKEGEGGKDSQGGREVGREKALVERGETEESSVE